jgi:hypothetical protein
VQAKIVNRELHKISSVPRELGDETKLTFVVGVLQVVSNTVYACTAVPNVKRKR